MPQPVTLPRVARTLHARTLHAWAGVVLSLLVIVVAASGALLVWKDAYLRLTIPEARGGVAPTPDALARIAEGIDATFEDDLVLFVTFAHEHLALSEVVLDGDEMAYVDRDGALVDRWPVGTRPEDWLFELHHRLLMKTTGLYIAGFAGLAVVVLIAAGAIAFWPARRAFRLGPWLRGAGREALLVSHRNIGIVAAPFIAGMALTGAALAFPDTARGLLMHGAEDDPSYGETFGDDVDDLSGADVAGWRPALARAQAAFPDATIRSAYWPNPITAYRVIGLQRAGDWNAVGRSVVYVDGIEGWMDLRIDERALPWEERVFNGLLPVHTATLGGWPYKVLATAVGVAFALLGALGLAAFLRRSWRTTS